MPKLITAPNVANPDEVYQLLSELHLGCSHEQSQRRNARLILTLVNHIGDKTVIAEAIDIARNASHRKAPF